MSTATAASNLTHLPHTVHPLSLREQAFTLHCQGLRSPAIAQELGVSERTIRAWIAAALDDLKDDLQLSRKEQLLLAVERQHQLTAAAWQKFEREAAARDALLDAALESLHAATSDATPDSAARPITIHLPASSLAPRYLSLILQAQKEANRLLGLYTLARLQMLTPETSETSETSETPPTTFHPSSPSHDTAGLDDESPAESAALTADCATPAESATATAPRPSVSSVSSVSSVVNSPLPAETATASVAPSPAFTPFTERAPALRGRDPRIPARTATSPARVAAGAQPASRHTTRAPHPWMM